LEIYQQLWNEALPALENGRPQLDKNLLNKSQDRRRGVSLAIRPSPAILEKLNAFVRPLMTMVPGQYFYQPEELHVTFLTIISGSEFWRKEIRRLAVCRALIQEILSRHKTFKIRFQGVTASPGAIMIQGFPDDGLEKIRSELRVAFTENGLEDLLDRRYKINSAHITVARFCQPEADWNRLTDFLKANRQTDFGEMNVETIQLVWGDWYASANTIRTLQQYHLRPLQNTL